MKNNITFSFEDVTNEPKRNMGAFSFFGKWAFLEIRTERY